MEAPFVLALTAGMVAAVNPCGFALLPGYLSLLVAADEGNDAPSRLAAVGRALAMTSAMTAGFVAVFGVFGLVVVPLALSVEQYLPWVTVLIGLGLLGLGVWVLTGREIQLATPKLRVGAPTRTLASMGLYGVSYAIASLSCTIGPFLALATSTFRTSSLAAGLLAFVAYAVGMGLVVGVLAMAAALARHTLVRWLRRVLPYVSRVSGGLMVLAGAYVAYYGWYELRVFSGGSADDPVVNAAVTAQSTLAGWLERIGAGGIALAFLSVLGLSAASVLLRRRIASSD